MSDVIPSAPSTASGNVPEESAVQLTHVTYALFALGLISAGLLAVAGLIVAYVKRDDVAGTYLKSHMDWLIRTFWWSLLWIALVWVMVILTIGIGIIVAWIPWGIVWIWGAYRIIKGWLRLSEKREVS
jgi:uncharacterized membrane protein